MDGDPSVEPELDSLSLTLPLPYRVALIAVLGTWGWGANLQVLHARKIDVPALLRYPGRASAAAAPHHATAFRLAAAASAVLGASLLLFWALTRRDPARVLAYDWLPMATLAVLAVVLAVPVPRWLARRWGSRSSRRAGGGVPAWASPEGVGSPAPSASSSAASSSSSSSLLYGPLPQDGRRRFAATLRRVALGGLAEPHHGKFADLLLADVLTSYAKVLGDLYVCLCMFFFTSRAGREASATDRPDRSCGGAVVVPLILAAPSLARLRQCLIEYGRARRAAAGAAAAAHTTTPTPLRGGGGGGSSSGTSSSSSTTSPAPSAVSSASGGASGGGAGAGGQHLANALKYATAFPVIVLAALQRRASAAAAADGSVAASAAAASLHRAWLAAVAVNSLYSFYWDVARDWDLTLFARATWRRPPAYHGSYGSYGSSYGASYGSSYGAYGARPPPGLRRRLLLRPAPAVYYGAVALDLVLRCTWALGLADAESGLFAMQVLEVVRRWVWLFFRIETEWIRSTGGDGGGGGSGGGSGGGLLDGGMSSTDILLGEVSGKYDEEE